MVDVSLALAFEMSLGSRAGEVNKKSEGCCTVTNTTEPLGDSHRMANSESESEGSNPRL